MQNRLEITQAILDQLPEEVRVGFKDLDDAVMYFWMNIREGGGYRLTQNGYNVLTKILKLEKFEIPIDPHHITKRNLIALDRKLAAPYYIAVRRIGEPKLVLFSSREAVMASLYGDLNSYLQTHR